MLKARAAKGRAGNSREMLETLFKGLYYFLILALIALGALLAAPILPIPGNYEVKIVQSGSMEPSINTGAIVVVKPQESYTVGDVVTFGEDDKTHVPTTHRIIADRIVEGTVRFTTKGDANEDQDPGEIALDDIIGKVVFDIPALGYVLDFARKPLGFALLIGIPAAVIVFDELESIWREMASMRRKKKESAIVDSHDVPKE
jgi:signal peptidase